MKLEEMSKEELIQIILKSRKKSKRLPIKTTKKEIINYWSKIKEESLLSVDWAEAETRCWRCGYERKLQRCHIIPDSLGGKDTPSNFVLLCERCHIDAPNIEDKNFMWDWIMSNKEPFYDTFFKKRALKEYEFIYNKKFEEELIERDILSHKDLEIFYNVKIGRSANHFAHPWKNYSTEAGILKMRIDAFDSKYGNRLKKSSSYRDKEKIFESLVWDLCDIAKKYNFNVWEGRTKNPFSIVLSGSINTKCFLNISIKLSKNKEYLCCFTNEYNPNNISKKDYNMNLGTNEERLKQFIEETVSKFCKAYGKPIKQEYVFTINPILRIKE